MRKILTPKIKISAYFRNILSNKTTRVILLEEYTEKKEVKNNDCLMINYKIRMHYMSIDLTLDRRH